jgi:glycine/D-amino acid oxidase-like deaminating enzyme
MSRDVVVVGAGVIGTAITFRLAEAGARVTLVDRAAPGRGTSSNSFAWVNANEKPPLGYHRLNAEGMLAHRRLRDDVQAMGGGSGPSSGTESRIPQRATWLHESGGLEWTLSEEGRERLLAKVERLRRWGYRIEVLDEAAVRTLEPHLCLEGMTAATFCPDEAWVDAPTFAAAVAGAAGAFGAEVRQGAPVTDLLRQGNRIGGVRLASGEALAAETVIVAAGRWTDTVAALAGVAVPLEPTCGLLAVTSQITRGVGRVVHVPGMNFRPDPGGGVVIQSAETDATVTPETVPDPALPGCAALLQRVQAFLPTVAGARVVQARVGVRPMPADGFSIVGTVPDRPGFYLVVTHSGVTLAPLLGELAAREVTGGGDDPRLAPFRPARCVRTTN